MPLAIYIQIYRQNVILDLKYLNDLVLQILARIRVQPYITSRVHWPSVFVEKHINIDFKEGISFPRFKLNKHTFIDTHVPLAPDILNIFFSPKWISPWSDLRPELTRNSDFLMYFFNTTPYFSPRTTPQTIRVQILSKGIVKCFGPLVLGERILHT